MQAQARESSFVNPDKRAYPREYTKGKNVAHTKSNNIIAHDAPNPEPPRFSAKAQGLATSWNNPRAVDGDTFQSPSKGYRPGQNQFAQSNILYGGQEEKKQQKKGSSVKAAEIGGSNAVNYLDNNQQQSQNLQKGSKRAQANAEGVRGSTGITSAIHGY